MDNLVVILIPLAGYLKLLALAFVAEVVVECFAVVVSAVSVAFAVLAALLVAVSDIDIGSLH